MLSRRELFRYWFAMGLLQAVDGVELFGQSTETDLRPATDAQIDTWLSQAVGGYRNQVGGVPVLQKFPDRYWALRQPLGWTPVAGEPNFPAFEAPIGFVTDLASIPRFFWTLLPPDDSYATAAILHDYLYWFQPWPKDDADSLLKFAMEQFQVDSWKVKAIYEGVHLHGSGAWNEDARLRNAGEKRVLKEFPTDATVTWAEWKQDPSHF